MALVPPAQETTVVNVNLHEFDVYYGRAGRGFEGYFGSPFKRKAGDYMGATLVHYRLHRLRRFRDDSEYRHRWHANRGKRLGCFCVQNPWTPSMHRQHPTPLVCHAQIDALALDRRPDDPVQLYALERTGDKRKSWRGLAVDAVVLARDMEEARELVYSHEADATWLDSSIITCELSKQEPGVVLVSYAGE